MTYKFNYEVLGDSCEVLGEKPPLTMKIRGNIMRFWGRYYEVLGEPSLTVFPLAGVAPDCLFL